MIVTICGAYRNAGDHLIGDRARALLRAHVDPDIVVVDRRSITARDYETFNSARAVLLTGGPAYQKPVYPTVYPIDCDKISRPIVPFGLGWKAAVNVQADQFKFTPAAEAFVRRIHKDIEFSSARDPLTVDVIQSLGIDNVLMTGCPAWYDPGFLGQPYRFEPNVKKIVLSMPAQMRPGVYDLMNWLSERFPHARRVVSFHHGVIPAYNRIGRGRAVEFIKFCMRAIRRGWGVASLAGSLEKLESLYGDADLQVGYRVHAHLFCLSRRISSILINEDARGVGQARALGARSLNVDKRGDIEPIKEAVERHFETRGEQVARGIAVMHETYPTMLRFLRSL